ncbi:MAG: type II toxin-antitoxin system HicA family toxin [Desulfobaccales bacterium]
MPRLKRLSGKNLIAIFENLGFAVLSTRGSHIKLRRVWLKERQTLTIPNHPDLDPGTCRAIFRQACRYIDPEELRSYFYSK